MAQGPAVVPKFGNWENGDHVPYTVRFEKARKGRTRTKINRSINSPQNSNSIDQSSSSLQIDHPKSTQHLPESLITAAAADSPLNRLSSGNKNRRGIRRNGNSDLSVVDHVSKVGSKGGIGVSSSPVYSLERKGSSQRVPMTPARSRLRSASRAAAAANDSVDENAAVPKFGDWDENNPKSGDRYTLIFNKVKEERYGGSTKGSNLSKQTSLSNSQKHYTNQNSKGVSCFCWG